MSDKPISFHIGEILTALGYDTQDQHFRGTPQRVEKALRLYARNQDEDTARKHLDAVFSDAHDSMVIVGPILVTSMCAHHMLPVRGRAWVRYIPNERVCGLSKLARIVGWSPHGTRNEEHDERHHLGEVAAGTTACPVRMSTVGAARPT